ncbi:MAG: site-specific DNA-methyltransferase [Deltaproteobacteria bacterium]|nr:site-specific DNA-methyltransferase [Deltaproteobacteria bacterium]
MKSSAAFKNSNLSLFADEPETPVSRRWETEDAVDDRPIAQNPPPPPHRPTSAVPTWLLRPLQSQVLKAQHDATTRTLVSLEEFLGRPLHAEAGFILYNRDCLEALRSLSGSRFRTQLTVTSPPYNIGKAYETVRGLQDYVQWSVDWITAVHGVTGPTGAFWLNLGYVPVAQKGRAVPIPYLIWDKTPFFLIQEVVWNYGAGVSARQSFSPRNEKWLFYSVSHSQYTFNLDDVRDPNVKYPNQKKNGKYRCNPLGKNPSDVWQFPKVTTGTNRSSKERTPHPAQFPLGIVERLVRVSSNSGDVVLDPFSGSASTGIAAVGTGRVFVGFEIREDYCRLSVERLRRFRQLRDEAERQPSLLNDDLGLSELY